jgi:hypothetical protein
LATKEIAGVKRKCGPAEIAMKGWPPMRKDTTSQSPEGVSCSWLT